jgi:hypothetical protein
MVRDAICLPSGQYRFLNRHDIAAKREYDQKLMVPGKLPHALERKLV